MSPTVTVPHLPRRATLGLLVSLLGLAPIATASATDPHPQPPSTRVPLTALAENQRAGCAIPATADPAVIRKVYEIGQARAVSAKVMLAMFEAGWVESHMNNLNCGQETSQGVFQIQTPMHGTPAQVRNVTWATNWFINTALPLEKSSATAGELAANVERPREDLRGRYQAAEGVAKDLMTRAKQPYGVIGTKYAQLGGSGGPVGPLLRAEEASKNGGRFQLFRNGIILWSPATGAKWVHGSILDTFWKTNSEVAWGFPTMDELDAAAAPDGTTGRYQYFQRGLFMWSQPTGVQVIHGEILKAFENGGREKELGYPTTGEVADGSARVQKFQRATIRWSADGGAVITKN
ncbi:LGFP repeat-containing protein [Dermacoccaceae bacterium W4C1]